ncbi:MAG TPA: RNA polymerase sigma factor [Anaerovoracaceae bacterium]|nr:RNA polymerase sigma factor [Anaerovoracaceae bacterium]
MNDQEIVDGLKERNIRALKRAFELYYRPVYYAAYFVTKEPTSAEDAAQEAFLTLWEKVNQLKDAAKIQGWLVRVASNKARDAIRKKAREVMYSEMDKTLKTDDDLPEPAVVKKEEEEIVREAIQSLPEDLQQLFYFRYFQEMTMQEISTTMGMPEGTVKSKLFRGRETVKKYLERRLGQ